MIGKHPLNVVMRGLQEIVVFKFAMKLINAASLLSDAGSCFVFVEGIVWTITFDLLLIDNLIIEDDTTPTC